MICVNLRFIIHYDTPPFFFLYEATSTRISVSITEYVNTKIKDRSRKIEKSCNS